MKAHVHYLIEWKLALMDSVINTPSVHKCFTFDFQLKLRLLVLFRIF
jgi:hypothetical protein